MKKLIIVFLFAIAFSGCKFGSETFTIAHLTDIHVSPGSEAEENLKVIVDDINKLKPDVVFVTGDLTNTGSNEELKTVKLILDRLKVPYFVIPGNHETNWSESAGLLFNQLWGNDRFVFKTADYLFVGFNTGPYMKMGDGHVKQEDLNWLRRVLSAPENQGRTLISLAHYPLADGLDNWVDVVNILKENNCKLDLCGHGHRLKLLNFDGIPGIMGRSLSSPQFNSSGYTLLELRNDSVIVSNKEPEGIKTERFFAFSLLSPDTIYNLEVSTPPDFSINSKYTDVNITFEWKDTASIFTGPCLVGDTLLVYGNSLGYIKGISIPEKKVIWQHRYEGSLFSTPVFNKGIVAFGNVSGDIIGLDAADGVEKWKINVDAAVLAEGIAENNALYIGGGDVGFLKIDITSGQVLWKFTGISGLVQGKPAIGKDEVIFGAWDRHLYCLDKETGLLRWKWNNGTTVKLYSPGNIKPVIANGKVFIVAPDRFMTALDLKTGKEIWRTNKHKVRESMGMSPDGNQVYAKLMNDSIIAMSSHTVLPKTIWAIDAGIGYDHNPCPITAGERWVAGATKNGLVTVVSSRGDQILWQYKVGNSSINKLVPDEKDGLWLTLMEGVVINIRYPMGRTY
ncbi:outer membrane protein assembly factor BamB family protein [Thermophagus sp. OGC60D27]|uniref:outer membrane protein assembly factor BamB family protein n=1 Tax=Thermophagus sp. OGC60D27 TaxID=3458415 RepID=UPI0040384492